MYERGIKSYCREVCKSELSYKCCEDRLNTSCKSFSECDSRLFCSLWICKVIKKFISKDEWKEELNKLGVELEEEEVPQ